MINPTRRASTDKSNTIIAHFMYMLMRMLMRMLTNKNSIMFATVSEQAENRVSQLDQSFSPVFSTLHGWISFGPIREGRRGC